MATPAAAEEPAEQEEQPPAVPEPPPASQSTPEDPPAAATPTAKIEKKRSHKKKGRNQYTRDDNEPSPARSQSGEAPAEVPPPPKPSKAEEKATGHGKHGKNKGGMNSKITMTDMKRRAAALLDFISRTQVELAGESPSDDDKTNGNSVAPQLATDCEKPGSATGMLGVNCSTPAAAMTSEGQLGKDFKDLSCVEMMDSLTRRLVKWQQEYTV